MRGKVVLGARLTARRMRFHLYPDPVGAAEGERVPRTAELTNVVVHLESLDGDGARAASSERTAPGSPDPPPTIRQENLTFVPHVVAILRGSKVGFPNFDPVFHNVFSLSRAASFDLGRYPRGSTRTVKFDEPGIVKVFCHIHSDMSAVVVVLDNAYFASPGPDGRYRIDGVPPGRWRAVAWHERARPVSDTVVVEAGRATTADFDIPLRDDDE